MPVIRALPKKSQIQRASTSAWELARALASKSPPLIIDVRQAGEYSEGHVKKSVNIPLSAVIAGVLEDSFPKRGRIVTVCLHGADRSVRAARELSSRGFDARFLKGGFEGWRAFCSAESRAQRK